MEIHTHADAARRQAFHPKSQSGVSAHALKAVFVELSRLNDEAGGPATYRPGELVETLSMKRTTLWRAVDWLEANDFVHITQTRAGRLVEVVNER